MICLYKSRTIKLRIKFTLQNKDCMASCSDIPITGIDLLRSQPNVADKVALRHKVHMLTEARLRIYHAIAMQLMQFFDMRLNPATSTTAIDQPDASMGSHNH